MDGPTEGSQGPSGSRLRSARWSSHRILLATWLVLIAVALGILAFAIAAQIDRSQFTYRVRTVVNPVGTCWRVGVDVDFKDMVFDDGRPFYDQCGGTPPTGDGGKCHTRVLVSAEIFPGLPKPGISVDIYRGDRIVQSPPFNASVPSPHSTQFSCWT